MMNDVRISIRGLSKRYRKSPIPNGGRGLISYLTSHDARDSNTFLALDNLSIDVKQGDRIGIVGRNGSGKSTLLKILSRVSVPTQGEVRIRGRLTALLEVGTGFDRSASGRTNIYLNAGLHGLSRDEIDARFEQIVEFSGVGDFLDTPVKHYSSGMYVRLAFSIAAHLEPDILLLDEVLAVGDIAFQQKCLARVESLTEDEQRTILFVSHSLGHVAQYCNKVMWLDQGKIQFFGGVTEGIELYSEFMNPKGSVNLREMIHRKGTQTVKIVSVSCGNSGREPYRSQTGSDISFDIEYEANGGFVRDLSHLMVNLVFMNEKKQRIFGVPSDVIEFHPDGLSRRGILRCVIKELPLLPGVYFYNVGLHINRQLTDKIEDAGKIVVFAGDVYGTGKLPARSFGEVCVPYSWSHSVIDD